MLQHVALLETVHFRRGYELPMRNLVEMFQDAGCENVRAHSQSDSLVFSAGRILASRAPDIVTNRFAREHDVAVSMMIRSLDELRALAGANPFLSKESEKLQLMFLADAPDLSRVAELDTKCASPGAFALCGANIFLYVPDPRAQSILNASYFDVALETTSIMRDWDSVQALVAMGEMGP